MSTSWTRVGMFDLQRSALECRGPRVATCLSPEEATVKLSVHLPRAGTGGRSFPPLSTGGPISKEGSRSRQADGR